MESRRSVVDINLFNDIIRCYQEALKTHTNLDEILLREIIQNDEFLIKCQKILTELQGAFESLKKARHILCGETNEDVVELQILKLELKADEESDEVTPLNQRGDRSRRDSQESLSSQAFSLRLEEDPPLDDNNDIDEETVDESEKGEGHHRWPSLSSLSFSKNEEICGWLQKQEETEKVNEVLERKLKSREKSLNEIATKLLEDLKKVGTSMENNFIISQIENGKYGTLEEKLETMGVCVLKINGEIRELKQMCSTGVSLDHNSILNANNRQDDKNCTSCAEILEKTFNRSLDDNSEKDSIDGRDRNLEPSVENKSSRKVGITRRQKMKMASWSKKGRTTSHNNGSFQCDECSSSFKLEGLMKKHIQEVHNRIRFFQCDQCSYSFKSNFNLKRHIQVVHSRVRSLQCDQCSFSFNRKHTLIVHIRNVHARDKI